MVYFFSLFCLHIGQIKFRPTIDFLTRVTFATILTVVKINKHHLYLSKNTSENLLVFVYLSEKVMWLRIMNHHNIIIKNMIHDKILIMRLKISKKVVRE